MDMETLRARLAQLRELLDTPHVCTTSLRARLVGGGATHFVYQCIECGQQRGGPEKKVKALQLLNGREAEPFDATLEEQAYRRRIALFEEARELQVELAGDSDEGLLAAHYKGLRDAAAAQSAKLKQAIAAFVDELCSEFPAALVQREMQGHLDQLKKSQWDEQLAATVRITTEDGLKDWLVAHLGGDFELFPEVRGTHLAHGVGASIDYIAQAKPHLVAQGFTAAPFGIEVKHLRPEEGFSSKAAKAFWQSVSYTDCVFALNDVPTRLGFCVLFSSMSFEPERALLRDFGDYHDDDKAVWKALQQLANHAQVGTLNIKGSASKYLGWAINFSGGTYYTAKQAPTGWTYSLSDANLISKARVGNFG